MRTPRLLALALAFVLFGQGCLADPPQPNRPIFFDVSESRNDNVLEPFAPGQPLPPTEVATGEIISQSGNVVVSSLAPNQELPNPFVILGRGRTFESVVNWRVTDSGGTVVAEGAVMTDAADIGEFGDYRLRAFYKTLPEVPTGTVQVFTYSPQNGAEQDIVRIPVKLLTETMPIQVFFISQEADPELKECDNPIAYTRRIVKTQNVAEAALVELLRGPTMAEDVFGARTGIAPGTRLRSVNLENGVATADFTRELVAGVAGSCRVTAIRAQIERTLTQFSSVNRVQIWTEGTDADMLLQP